MMKHLICNQKRVMEYISYTMLDAIHLSHAIFKTDKGLQCKY